MLKVSSNYFDAQVPEPWQILGLKLLPFSVGHFVILSKLDSFAVNPNVKYNEQELLQAIWVCAHSYAENLRMLDDPRTILRIMRWHRVLTGRNNILHAMHLKKKPPAIDWAEKGQMFMNYMAEMENTPTYSISGENAKSVDLPMAQVLKVTLMRELGLSEMEVMDRPWALAVWDYITIKAMEGQVDVFDGEQLDQLQEKANRLGAMMSKRMNGEN